MKSGKSIDRAELRRRAEQHLPRQAPASDGPLSTYDAQKLVHELQVHQIELELQNEELRLAQAEVGAALARYAEFHDFSPVGLFTLKRDGAIAEVNLTGAHLLGLDRARLIGAHFAAFVATKHRPAFNTLLQQVFAAKSGQSCEVELATESQPPRPVQINATLSADGQECRTVITDIAELREGRMRLQQSQDLIDKLSRHVPGVIYQYRLFPDGRASFPYASEGIREIYEVTPGEVHDDASIVLSRLHPEDVDTIVASIQESARTLQPWQLEYRVRLPKKGERWLAGHGRPEKLDDGSTLWHGFITDVTETKRIDDVLRFLAQSGGVIGPEGFFRPLARYLAKALNVDYICIDRLVDDNLSAVTLAVYFDGRFDHNLVYRLQDTPCGDVVGKNVCVFPSGVRQRFPRDAALQELAAEGYIGVTLWSSNGRPIGLIAAISRQPIGNVAQAESILKLVAIRAASELEREQAEAALLESQQHLAEAQRIGRLGSWQLNIASGQLVLSDEVFHMAGLDPAQPPPAYSDGHRLFSAESWERLQAALTNTETTGNPCELTVETLRQDGSHGWVWLRGETLRDAKGATIALRGVARDITESRRAEDQLRKLSLAVEQSPESIAITNLDVEMEYVNESLLRTSGYSREELLGRNPRMLGSGNTPPETYAAMWAALKQGQAWRGEFYNRRKDGSEYIEFAQVSPLRQADGRITHYVAIKEDISEKKRIGEELDRHRHHLEALVTTRTEKLLEQTKAAEAASIAKSAFLANMSHEIRTPMNAILGMANLLRRTGITAAQADKLNKIDTAGQHLMEVINDILDISKIEAGKFVIEEVRVDVSALVADVATLLSERAQSKGLKLVVATQALPHGLLGDATRLRQALLNYGGNAIKFTDSGTISLRAMLEDESEDSALVRLEVHDTGIGLDAETKARLFSTFEQADNTMTRKYGGTGLGLAITRRLAELMGGTADVDSSPGAGSTFWFTARLKKEKRAALAEPAGHGEANAELTLKQRFCGKRILLVDDDAVNREVARVFLEDTGLVVDMADDGDKAVEMAAAQEYALILMDMQMPTMDGLEATRRIRASAGGTRVPIVAMTANAYANDRQRCTTAGMDDFIAKPFNPGMFFATILKRLAEGR